MKINRTNLTERLLNSIRKVIAGRESRFCFKRPVSFNASYLESTGLYVHIPFCKSLCPYCPYNRIGYNEALMNRYIDALVREIDFYGRHYSRSRIDTVYFGGGTPTLAGKRLIEITDALRKNFNISSGLCIETNPDNINETNLGILKECGFNSISIGIQTFNEHMLKLIGRKYSAEDADNALQNVRNAEFKHINADLLFALPGQTVQDITMDIEHMLKYEPSQITFYPLFTFPYAEISRYRDIKSVKSPSLFKRRHMFYAIYDKMIDSGYEQCSVWSFRKRGNNERYSSVTRERYLGLGASSGSYYESYFTLNTFNIQYYIELIKRQGHSVVLDMPFTKQMSELYDFYWRLYDTKIPVKRNLIYSNYNVHTHRSIKVLMKIMKYMAWIRKSGNHYEMTRSGSMWIHFIQNIFSLRYIDKIWGQGKKHKSPKRIYF